MKCTRGIYKNGDDRNNNMSTYVYVSDTTKGGSLQKKNLSMK